VRYSGKGFTESLIDNRKKSNMLSLQEVTKRV
jgi:hypothetical protein